MCESEINISVGSWSPQFRHSEHSCGTVPYTWLLHWGCLKQGCRGCIVLLKLNFWPLGLVDAERRVVLRRLQRRKPRTVRRRVRVERWRVVKGHVWKGRVVESTLQPGVVHPVVVDVPSAEVLLDDVEVVAVRLAGVVDRVVQELGAAPAQLVGVELFVVVPAELAVAVVDRVLLGRRQVVDVVVVLEDLCHVVGREVAVVHCWIWCGRLVVCRCAYSRGSSRPIRPAPSPSLWTVWCQPSVVLVYPVMWWWGSSSFRTWTARRP